MYFKLYKEPNFITFGNVGSGRGVVETVNGKSGEVTLDTGDIPEGASNKYMTQAERDKLASLDPSAAGLTGGEIKTLYETEADTNAFDDAFKSKLESVEDGAKDDQSGAQIKSLYEAEADTNAFTDVEKAKLDGISPGGGGNVQADMAESSTVAGSFINGMGTTGRAVALLETEAELRSLVTFEQAYDTVSEMLASVEPGQEGQLWRAGAFRYKQGANTAADHQLETAGGVKLYVLPAADGTYSFACMAPHADGVTDDYPKLVKLIDAVSTGSGYYVSGPSIFFPNARYLIGQTLELKKVVHLHGQSSGIPFDSGAELVFPADTMGIVVNYYNTLNGGVESTPTGAASSSLIEGLRITSNLGSDPTAHGIWLRGRAVLRNVYIANFTGNGINIVAGAASSDPSFSGNSNSWSIETVRIQQCGRNGIYVDGADSNAGFCQAADCSANGRWGIYDSSFLGNTYIACHTASNGVAGVGANGPTKSSFVAYNGRRYVAHPDATESDLVSVVPGTDDEVWIDDSAGGATISYPTWLANQPDGTYFSGGSYKTDSLNARNVLIGCYAESGQGAAAFDGPTMCLGGLLGIAKGSTIQAQDGGQVTLANIFFKQDKLSVSLLDDVSNGEIMKWGHSDDNAGWVWRLRRKGTDFVLDNANSGARTAFTITGEHTTLQMGTGSTQPYLFNLQKLALGQGSYMRRHTTGISAPTSGEFARGDIIYNVSPVAGGNIGWVCTAAGAPGTWKTFGAISA